LNDLDCCANPITVVRTIYSAVLKPALRKVILVRSFRP